MSSRPISNFLEQMLAGGPFQIGQIRIVPKPEAIELRHVEDAEIVEGLLASHETPDAARFIALYDPAGKYRPLKSAPNLARGWRIVLPDAAALRLALDAFYPAAIGMWVRFTENKLRPVSWRETVSRQTGMYRVVGKITDEQSVELVCKACDRSTGCLRRILWPVSEETTHPLQNNDRAGLLALPETSREVPILCIEACNLLVAAGRKVVKGEA